MAKDPIKDIRKLQGEEKRRADVEKAEAAKTMMAVVGEAHKTSERISSEVSDTLDYISSRGDTSAEITASRAKAIAEAEEKNIELNKSQIRLRAKQIREEEHAQKRREDAEQLIKEHRLAGNKQTAEMIEQSLADREASERKIQQDKEKRENVARDKLERRYALRDETTKTVLSTALGPLGSFLDAGNSMWDSAREQMNAVREIGSRAFSFVGGKKRATKEDRIQAESLKVLAKNAETEAKFAKQDRRNMREARAEGTAKALATGATQTIDGVKDDKDDLGFFGALKNKAKGILTAVGTAVAAFGGMLMSGVKGMFKGAGKLIARFFPLAAIALAVYNFVVGGIDSFIASDAKSMVGKITEGIFGGLASIVDFVTFGFLNKEKIMSFVQPAIDFMDNLGPWFTEKLLGIKDHFSVAWDGIKDSFTGIGTAMVDMVSNVVKVVKDFYSSMWNNILELVAKAVSFVSDDAAAALRAKKIDISRTDEKTERISKLSNKSAEVNREMAIGRQKNDAPTIVNAASSTSNTVTNNTTEKRTRVPIVTRNSRVLAYG